MLSLLCAKRKPEMLVFHEGSLRSRGAVFIVHRPDSSGDIHNSRQNTQKHQNEEEIKTQAWSCEMAYGAIVIRDRRALPSIFMRRG